MKDKLKSLKNLIDNNDKFDEQIGKRVVEIFKLKKDRSSGHKDRYQTSGGSKRVAGVARTLYRIIEEAGFDINNGATGQQIVETFKLRKDPEFVDRFQTIEGTKTYLGIAAVAARIIADEAENLPKEYLIRSKTEQGFWSNEDGWVHDVESATKFDAQEASEPANLISSDAEWAHISEAVDFDPDSDLTLS